MITVQRSRIDPKAVIESVRRSDAGAVVLFLGTVRGDPGVSALDYEAYRSMAHRKLSEVATTAKTKFGVLNLSVVHRLGRIPVGEVSVAIACASAHRGGAFAACAWVMDEVKRIVPIWKSKASRARPRRSRSPGAKNRSAGARRPRATPHGGEEG